MRLVAGNCNTPPVTARPCPGGSTLPGRSFPAHIFTIAEYFYRPITTDIFGALSPARQPSPGRCATGNPKPLKILALTGFSHIPASWRKNPQGRLRLQPDFWVLRAPAYPVGVVSHDKMNCCCFLNYGKMPPSVGRTKKPPQGVVRYEAVLRANADTRRSMQTGLRNTD